MNLDPAASPEAASGSRAEPSPKAASPGAPEAGPDRLRWTGGERLTAVAIAALFSLVATWTAVGRERQEAAQATQRTLDAVVDAVDAARRQTRHAPSGPVEMIFLGDRLDAWGRPLRVDADKAIVYSLGPDGLDQGGEGDDLVRYLPSLSRSGIASQE